jgi:phage portal protein BeeE
VAIHNQATRWNKALLDNAARPSGALVYDPGDGAVLSSDQYERLKGEIDASLAGAAMPGGRCCWTEACGGRLCPCRRRR